MRRESKLPCTGRGCEKRGALKRLRTVSKNSGKIFLL